MWEWRLIGQHRPLIGPTHLMLGVTNETVIKWRLSFFDLGSCGCTFQLFFLIKHPIYTHVTFVNVSDIQTWHFYEVRKLLMRTEKWSNLWSMLTLKPFTFYPESCEEVWKIWCEKIWQLSWHFGKLSLSLRNITRLFANKLSAAFSENTCITSQSGQKRRSDSLFSLFSGKHIEVGGLHHV